MPVNSFEAAITLAEYLLLAVGLFVGWRHVVRSAARARFRNEGPTLAPWDAPLPDFLVTVFLIFGGGMLAAFSAGLLLNGYKLPTEAKAIVSSAALQFGLLIAAALVPLKLGHHPLRPPLDGKTLRSGLATFVIALPIVTVANLAWMEFLKAVGLPVEQQDLLKIFMQTDSTPMLVVMIGLATIVAPVAEELLFRATIFRYLRTRVSRWIALIGPGLIFAALHVNWASKNLEGLPSFVPLVTLAVIFSVAYERTGRIGTPMVAHGLFNLHTILLLFAGVTQ